MASPTEEAEWYRLRTYTFHCLAHVWCLQLAQPPVTVSAAYSLHNQPWQCLVPTACTTNRDTVSYAYSLHHQSWHCLVPTACTTTRDIVSGAYSFHQQSWHSVVFLQLAPPIVTQCLVPTACTTTRDTVCVWYLQLAQPLVTQCLVPTACTTVRFHFAYLLWPEFIQLSTLFLILPYSSIRRCIEIWHYYSLRGYTLITVLLLPVAWKVFPSSECHRDG